jgi:catechol 2,3-dioxygenase-like lactoylglutathione lyase family enzyme
MESIISSILSRFENGSLSRRQLVQCLAVLAGTATAAAAQEDVSFETATIDHVSIQVVDVQAAVDFYQKIFGFSVMSHDAALGITHLGNSKMLVSLNQQRPAGVVDHFAIGIPNFKKETAARYLSARGGTPLNDRYAGLHVKDPDGINVQIFSILGSTHG